MKRNHCGHLGCPIDAILARFDPEVIQLLQSKFRLKATKGLERDVEIDFQDDACGSHLGFFIGSFSYFVSTKCLMLIIKFGFNWIIEMSKI